MEKKVGITIITGYLGSGKTSIINQIIKKEVNLRFAIIENEFSQFGIDSALIKGIDNANIIELSNGCICCVKNTELQETLSYLLEADLKFDHILMETTGIAEPDAIVQSIVSNQNLSEQLFIDSVICLADAVHFHENMKNEESVKQLAISDIIILNKIDSTTETILLKIENEIQNLNPMAEIIRTSFSDYGTKKLMAAGKFNQKNFNQLFQKMNQPYRILHTDRIQISSLGISIEGKFSEEKFRFWMEYFLMLNQSEIYRMKGILNFAGNPRKVIFQSVRASYSLEEGDFWNASEDRMSKLVIIGKNPENLEIEESMKLLLED
ncbi:MAG: GTP-binding protein [Bacteroidales bacterium]